MRELFVYHNFNSDCFINYEVELIKSEADKLQTNQEVNLFLQTEQSRISRLKIKSGISFDHQQPSLKTALDL